MANKQKGDEKKENEFLETMNQKIDTVFFLS